MIPPDPLNASAAKNFILLLGSLGLTIPVGWTYTYSISTVYAPIFSDMRIPDPSQWSPLVVGK
jgi:hypothetical protein